MDDPKAPFRKKGRAVRPLPEEVKASQKKIISHLSSIIEPAKQVGVFRALPWEVDLSPLWKTELYKFVFPRVEGTHIQFFRIESEASFRSGFAAIEEPTEGETATWDKGDVLLIPGAMFDTHGARIGSGKGFYDRFLKSLNVPVVKVGVCWAEQLSHEPLPQLAYDVRMDAICTEEGLIWAERRT